MPVLFYLFFLITLPSIRQVNLSASLPAVIIAITGRQAPAKR